MTRPSQDPQTGARVADGLDDAAAGAGQGQTVVLLIDPASAPDALSAVTPLVAPGRVALFVGDPASSADRAAAEAMAEELYGHR